MIGRALVVAVVGLGCAASAPQTGGAKSASAPAPTAPAGSKPQAATAPATAPLADGTIVQLGPVEKLIARESSGLTPRPLSFADGNFTAEVESSAPPTAKRTEGFWTVTVPVGSEDPVACYVYDKPMDVAATLVRFIRRVREGAKDISVQQILPTEAGVVGEDPYIIVVLAYTKVIPAGTLVGQVKMFVRPALDAPLFCVQDELGFLQTFKRVTQGLARSLKARTPSPPPLFVEIHVAHLGDIPVGFGKRTVVVNANGVKYEQDISCHLVPRSPQDLNGTDNVTVERSDAQGRLEQIYVVELDGEEIESQLQLAREGDARAYVVKGKKSGKEVSARFKSKEKEGLPSSSLVASRLRAALLGGKAGEVRVQEFHAGLSLEPLEVIYRNKKPGPDITVTIGQLEASAHLDDSGMVDRISMPIGPSVLREERVLIRGTP